MRIAHFIQRYPPALGGSEAYFARLGGHLARRGDAVTVFTSTALDLSAFWSARGQCAAAGVQDEDGISVRRYPLWRCAGRRYLLKALSLVPHRLWQCLTLPCNPIAFEMWRDAGSGAFAFDAVHASAFPYAWPIACAWRLARRLGVPFLLTPFLHLGDPTDPYDRTRQGYTSPPLRWLLRQADAVFVQTPSERAMALELGVAAECVQLQGLGVDPAECTGGARSVTRRFWGIHPGEIIIGHLANASREKGTTDLLEAMALLWKAEVPARLVLAGPEMPSFTAHWLAFERTNPAARGRVVRLGVLSGAEKRDFFAGLDLFALPSRSDSFGLVILEAWANGVPNVGYRAGGIADVIRHEVDGLLVCCGDVAGLAEALRHMCVNAGLRARLGEAGRSRLADEFGWSEKLEMVRMVTERLVREKVRTDPAPKDAANLKNTESVRIS